MLHSKPLDNSSSALTIFKKLMNIEKLNPLGNKYNLLFFA
jgi:hypothetical protein